ncbi:hypothetical protein E4631_24585 [Hymenobacter sp. UV11]|uniref:hypothetical protein n=1 Tax=Hymenobacter sp. UV11 TaxID=1849735 RepID=UPI00105BD5EA|nr:hypothetical protein [Hymenobacter sp. UV11]TDN36830.1 hypothetical protein A8B98_07010 [Hymenobacter sp. UV11]TFZ62734.1 hypothetical protein E4631_24585 [Hymenobacter sp. UV11]
MEMLYTSRLFAAELLVEVERGLVQLDSAFDPVRLGHWATGRYLAYVGRMEEGLADRMQTIQLLEDGPEFEMSIDQIRAFAKAML